MKDAYDGLFKKYPISEFFSDSLDQIIFIESEKLKKNWNEQKRKLLNNEELFIRWYWRDALGTKSFFILYNALFLNEKIQKDPTNNHYPTKLITELTKLSKTNKKDWTNYERIQNYQVSHLFWKTKNPLLFTAAWNIAYIPKYLDPFTGHETQWIYRNEFLALYIPKINLLFKEFIEDYNRFVDEYISPNIENSLNIVKEELQMNEKEFIKFKNSVESELSKITLPH